LGGVVIDPVGYDKNGIELKTGGLGISASGRAEKDEGSFVKFGEGGFCSPFGWMGLMLFADEVEKMISKHPGIGILISGWGRAGAAGGFAIICRRWRLGGDWIWKKRLMQPAWHVMAYGLQFAYPAGRLPFAPKCQFRRDFLAIIQIAAVGLHKFPAVGTLVPRAPRGMASIRGMFGAGMGELDEMGHIKIGKNLYGNEREKPKSISPIFHVY
jgi:hypothetical protein